MRIDSHQHFWRYDPLHYSWLDEPMAALRRDFLPADLAPELRASGLEGCIAVQAPQSLAETRFLLALADQSPLVRGVVGWVDLCSADVLAQLREFAGHPRFVGVRHIVQGEADDRFVLRSDFLAGIAALAPFDLVYDVLVFPHQLPAAIELCARFPQQRFVLDHLGKPRIKQGELQPWADRVRTLARLHNVTCKLSGLVTEADWRNWTPGTLRPYVDVALDAFGPERLMFGSDWPVCLVASSHRLWVEVVEALLAPLTAMQRQAVFGDNAARVYRLRD